MEIAVAPTAIGKRGDRPQAIGLGAAAHAALPPLLEAVGDRRIGQLAAEELDSGPLDLLLHLDRGAKIALGHLLDRERDDRNALEGRTRPLGRVLGELARIGEPAPRFR